MHLPVKVNPRIIIQAEYDRTIEPLLIGNWEVLCVHLSISADKTFLGLQINHLKQQQKWQISVHIHLSWLPP